MKAKTRVIAAAKDFYEVYTEYSRKILGVPVVIGFPQVTWRAGNRKDGARGLWLIDGREYHGTADEVVALFQQRAAAWEDKLRRKSDPVQMPLPPETYTVENQHGGRKLAS